MCDCTDITTTTCFPYDRRQQQDAYTHESIPPPILWSTPTHIVSHIYFCKAIITLIWCRYIFSTLILPSLIIIFDVRCYTQ